LVGEFFEVRAQVDRDLTTVSWFDRLLGFIKNLGRHRCLVTLRCFISRLDEKGLPLYRLLKKHERFSWTVEAQKALDNSRRR
jgi:hypothetical protein